MILKRADKRKLEVVSLHVAEENDEELIMKRRMREQNVPPERIEGMLCRNSVQLARPFWYHQAERSGHEDSYLTLNYILFNLNSLLLYLEVNHRECTVYLQNWQKSPLAVWVTFGFVHLLRASLSLAQVNTSETEKVVKYKVYSMTCDVLLDLNCCDIQLSGVGAQDLE